MAMLLVVGGGACGLLAALIASRSGARVMIVDDRPHPGGHLRTSQTRIDTKPAMEWVTAVSAELDANQNVTRLQDATAWGYREITCFWSLSAIPPRNMCFSGGGKPAQNASCLPPARLSEILFSPIMTARA